MLTERIKLLCQQNNMTLADLADKIGISRSTISRWNKENTPSSTTLSKIADFFNVSTDYLLGRENVNLDISKDPGIIKIQRARENMTLKQKEKMMNILKASFDDEKFWEETDDLDEN